METLIKTEYLENEIKDIRALEAKIIELDERFLCKAQSRR